LLGYYCFDVCGLLAVLSTRYAMLAIEVSFLESLIF
jgi:hypothetical protein